LGLPDRFGEKLSEVFVGEVLRNIMAKSGSCWRFAMLAPAVGRYELYLEGQSSSDLPALLDVALRANPHYAYCRDLGQLGMPSVFKIKGDAWAAYSVSLVAQGKRLGEITPVALHPSSQWHAVFSAVTK
jgi:hypothetical protein